MLILHLVFYVGMSAFRSSTWLPCQMATPLAGLGALSLPLVSTTLATGDITDPTMDTSYLQLLQSFCGPSSTASSSSALVNLDVSTADTFDNKYYKNLRASKGLLAWCHHYYICLNTFAANQKAFFSAFAASMIKMGNISPLTSQDNSQIRTNCHFVNTY